MEMHMNGWVYLFYFFLVVFALLVAYRIVVQPDIIARDVEEYKKEISQHMERIFREIFSILAQKQYGPNDLALFDLRNSICSKNMFYRVEWEYLDGKQICGILEVLTYRLNWHTVLREDQRKLLRVICDVRNVLTYPMERFCLRKSWCDYKRSTRQILACHLADLQKCLPGQNASC